MPTPPQRRRPNPTASFVLLTAIAFSAAPLAAQEHEHEHEGDDHGHALHFTHPLLAESVTPDTKLRLDYATEDGASEMELEGEYRFAPSFSVEAGVHFDPEGGELEHGHVVAKAATMRWAEQRALIGFGLEVGFRLASENPIVEEEPATHGHDETADLSFAPFLNGGLIRGPVEIVGWTLLEVPSEAQASDPLQLSTLRYHTSILLHATPTIQPVLETTGRAPLSADAGESTFAVAPGIEWRPMGEEGLMLGAASAFPLVGDGDTRLLFSVFYHF